MNSKSCFIIGLPSAGKTTYLAALSYSLQQKKVKTKLCWNDFTENHQYLTELIGSWLSASPVARTSISAQQSELSFKLSDNDGNDYIVTLPDLSGETFQNQYKDREIDENTANSIKNCDGIILFINPSMIFEPTLIAEISPEIRATAKEISTCERNPIDCDPTEVQLVEILHFVEFLRSGKSIPLTIIVSAWDMMESLYSSPEACLKKRTPLLWQYMYANKNLFTTNYFGVSAQGGEINDDTDAEALLKTYRKNPAERIKVVDNSKNICHDISLPLWTTMNLK